jgi:hypothetical protein
MNMVYFKNVPKQPYLFKSISNKHAYTDIMML